MAQGVRRLLLLGAVNLAVTGNASEEKLKCALDGAKSVSQMSDAAVYLWAASQRCRPEVGGNPLTPKCEVDIASAIEAVNGIILTMVAAVHDCGHIHTQNYKCGMAVGELTKASAGLAGTGGEMADECPSHALKPLPKIKKFDLARKTTLGKCFTDAEKTAASLFKATVKLAKVDEKCAVIGSECGANALNIIAALSNMGAALAASVNHCEKVVTGHGDEKAACSSSVLKAVSILHEVADAGTKISEVCHVDEEEFKVLEQEGLRLFQQKGKGKGEEVGRASIMGGVVNLAMMMAFVAGAFVGGWTLCVGTSAATARLRRNREYTGMQHMSAQELSTDGEQLKGASIARSLYFNRRSDPSYHKLSSTEGDGDMTLSLEAQAPLVPELEDAPLAE